MSGNVVVSFVATMMSYQVFVSHLLVLSHVAGVHAGNASRQTTECLWQTSPRVLPILNSTNLVHLTVDHAAFKIVRSRPIPKAKPSLGSEAFRKNVAELAFSSDLTKKAGRRIVTTQATSGDTGLELSTCMHA